MSKILGSWSGMRKYLEKEMLAESLKGRIRYGCTRYVGMDGCHIFEVCIDGKQVKRFSGETVNTYFIESGYTKNPNPVGIGEYWADFWPLLDRYPITKRTEYTDDEFCEALERYRSQEIQESLTSENPLVRMFAILDRRVGKRTLLKQKETVGEQPLWLQQFYRLRFDAENVSLNDTPKDIITAHRFSVNNRPALEKDEVCGCFHCLAVFSPKEIDRYLQDHGDEAGTALCPHCGIDAVLGESAGFPLTPDFLAQMKAHWFAGL